MVALRTLVVCTLVLWVRGYQYTPQERSEGSCSDLPVDLTADVQQRLEEIEGDVQITEQLSELTASVETLNSSLQRQISELAADVRDIQAIVGNIGTDPTTTDSTTNTPQTTETTPTPSTSIGSFLNPASSCKGIPLDSPSGEYWIQNSKTGGVPVQAYCDMTRNCSGITGGWMRVANLDMTDLNQHCPSEFRQVNRTTPPFCTCGRLGEPGCDSTMFSVYEPSFTHVCGRIIGYQYGGASAFNNALTILSFYVTGVSLTYDRLGHIWSFAAARDEVSSTTSNICPCTRPELTHTGTVPTFVGNNYFCDTGSETAFVPSNNPSFYAMDPLWDGQGCGGTSTCCEFNDPPWFSRQLSESVVDDIELRICHSASTQFADTPVEIVELYVR